jgi:hypothetical protein
VKVLLRALPFIAHCHVGSRGKNGWLTLAGTEDIFWFEFNDKPQDALEFSIQTLNMLSEYINDADALSQISAWMQKLVDTQRSVKAAVVGNY